ncbi:MAG: hypothetical protein F4142_07705 [Nitrospira sp. SB0675_bin_23]|nr:hypothetical protein [Nitrospira sp. SB0667_bin_9]MYH02446.1 hypothetical protein [Nitrospira sp. SB0675_bin_23]MYJ22206.1 hypothetical protein [Nitrospira sp. SB0673_bin_12]
MPARLARGHEGRCGVHGPVRLPAPNPDVQVRTRRMAQADPDEGSLALIDRAADPGDRHGGGHRRHDDGLRRRETCQQGQDKQDRWEDLPCGKEHAVDRKAGAVAGRTVVLGFA